MKITVQTTVKADLDKTWAAWNNPDDIKQWNTASEDWHTTKSIVDLRVGGQFSSRMEAKDGSMGFDFGGTYSNVINNKFIEFHMDDGRGVAITFEEVLEGTKIIETFDAESDNDPEFQKQGWQSILDNFAKYVESKA